MHRFSLKKSMFGNVNEIDVSPVTVGDGICCLFVLTGLQQGCLSFDLF